MKNLKDILREAFITKANLSKLADDGVDFEKLDSIKKQIFTDPSKIWSCKELTKVLERANLMPEGNIFKNSHISDIQWQVRDVKLMYGNGFIIAADFTIKLSTGQPVAYRIPICTILKDKILAPHENIGCIVNSEECTENVHKIINDIYDLCEKISEYLDIPIKDRRNAIQLD